MSDDLVMKVRQRAYLIWERENRPEGRHLEHWLRAEAEIEAEQPRSTDQAEQLSAGQPVLGVAENAGAASKAAAPATKRRAG
jgi:hypothetical protein